MKQALTNNVRFQGSRKLKPLNYNGDSVFGFLIQKEKRKHQT